MSGQKHIIRKQLIELECANRSDGFHVQQEVGQLCRDSVQPAMEKLFDQLTSADTVLSFGRVEIDLGYIQKDKLRSEFSERLLNRLEQILLDFEIGATGGAPSFPGFSQGARTTEQPFAEKKPALRAELENLLFFLENGFLPWHADPQGFASIDSRLSDPVAFSRACLEFPEFARRLYDLIRRDRQAFQRLLQGYSPEFQRRVFESLTDELTEEKALSLSAITFLLDAIGRASWAPVSIHSETSELLLRLVLFRQETLELQALGAFFRRLAGRLNLEFTEMIDRVRRQVQDREIPDSSPRFTEGLIILERLQENHGGSDPPEKKSGISPHPHRETSPGGENLQESTRPQLPGEEQSEKVIDDDHDHRNRRISEEVIYIENAGLALTHPFFLELFTSLKFIRDKEFASVLDREKAVVLLEYIARKEENPDEFTLCLNKILCGMELKFPVDSRHIVLADAEKEEADKLLGAVVGHWKALRGSSIDALRANFLLREGKLTSRNGEWQLQVEHKPQDVLLNQLPWGISLIKLPWMPGALSVEWV